MSQTVGLRPKSRLESWLIRYDRVLTALLLMLFFGIALSIAITQPHVDTPPDFGNPPDEHARFLVPKFIEQYGVLPNGFEEEIRIPGYGFSYALYNTFPYIVMGYAMRMISLFTKSGYALLLTARLISVFTGVLMAFVVKKTGENLFSDRRFSWLFTLFVVFLPESLFVHTYVNTDSMCMLSIALILYALSEMFHRGVGWKNSVFLMIGCSLLILSYYNAYTYLISAVLLFVSFFIRRENGKTRVHWRDLFKYGLFIAGGVLVLAGWWFVRSAVLHDGDFLGLTTRRQMEDQYGIGSNALSLRSRGYSFFSLLKNKAFFIGLYESFIAVFGSMSIYAPKVYYVIYFVILLAGGLSFLIFAKTSRVPGNSKLFYHLNLLICLLGPIVLTIYYAYASDYQFQGRYILPGLMPLMYFVVKGLERMRKALKKVPERAVSIGLVSMASLWMIMVLVYVYGLAFPVYLNSFSSFVSSL